MKWGQSFGRANSPGSQKYLQDLVNYSPGYLNELIISSSISLSDFSNGDIEWVSPLERDNFKEYRDDSFLWPIQQAWHYKKLGSFWPSTGPQWDGLAIIHGKDDSKGTILAEAKATTYELGGPHYACRSESGYNIERINSAFSKVKDALRVDQAFDWMGDYYQYVNRIAHLYFLHVICDIPTWLVYLYFISRDADEKQAIKYWENCISGIYNKLGLPEEHILSERMINAFPLVSLR
ncbi:MAG: hypothetical protein HY606_02585 [Planctomycetes bacterium]|nr:hypothetical protein [Planctomycetota bacterium]